MSNTERARQLRRNATPSEKLLWPQLRGRRFANFKFRRQQPVGPFIVDYFCADARVIVELDGESHVGKEPYDEKRESWLTTHGYKVLRVWDNEIFGNLDKVMEMIYEECKARSGEKE
jgi:very-short-patch-repair endonuclease